MAVLAGALFETSAAACGSIVAGLVAVVAVFGRLRLGREGSGQRCERRKAGCDACLVGGAAVSDARQRKQQRTLRTKLCLCRERKRNQNVFGTLKEFQNECPIELSFMSIVFDDIVHL